MILVGGGRIGGLIAQRLQQSQVPLVIVELDTQPIARLRSQAFEDALVRLPNRLALINSIDQEIEQGMPPDHVLVLINIDQFSGINDTLGHLYGDQLLKSVAMRLRNHLPQECMVARVGGDIFGLFGPLAELRPEKLFTLFSMPLPIGNASHSITVSIGAVDLMQGEKWQEYERKIKSLTYF